MVADTPENLRLKQQSELQSQVRGRGWPCGLTGREGCCNPWIWQGLLPPVVTKQGQGAEILVLALSPCPHPGTSCFLFPAFIKGVEEGMPPPLST